MSIVAASPASPSARARSGAAADPRRVENVRGIFLALAKHIGAKTIYAENSPMVAKFGEALQKAVRAFFEDEKELRLTIEQYRITWCDETVYDNRDKKESIAFLLFKDGVGELTIQSEIEPEELERFVDLVKNHICSASAHDDIVDKLWQAEFAHLSYRVFDEAVDAAKGDGRGADNDSGEQRLRLDDHPSLASGAQPARGNSGVLERSAESLGAHLMAVVERAHPGAGARDRERLLQELQERLFTLNPDELASLRAGFVSMRDRDKLLWLLRSMLDFTRANNPAPVAGDVLDIIHRLVRSIAEEGDVPTLIELLKIQQTLATDPALGPRFESLPQRIKRELTNTAFLLALGKKVGRSGKGAREILEYFQSIGTNAVPAMREILASSSDAAIHAKTCDAIVSVARDYIESVVDDLRPDNLLEAQDAVYMLRQCITREVPSVLRKYLSHPDARVRGGVVEYLAEIGTDEAAALLCTLLADADAGVRIRTIAAVENLPHPSIVAAVTSMCFDQDSTSRSMEELQRLFRAVGKLAGADVLPRILRMAGARSLFSMGGRARQDKLLAISALRYIRAPEARAALEKLAGDGNDLVKNVALHALKAHDGNGAPDDQEAAVAAGTGGADV